MKFALAAVAAFGLGFWLAEVAAVRRDLGKVETTISDANATIRANTRVMAALLDALKSRNGEYEEREP